MHLAIKTLRSMKSDLGQCLKDVICIKTKPIHATSCLWVKMLVSYVLGQQVENVNQYLAVGLSRHTPQVKNFDFMSLKL